MRRFLHRLLHWLAALLEPTATPGPLTGIVIFEQGGIRSMGEITVIEGDPPISASVSYVNQATGDPAEAADTPVWSSADDSIASVEASSDGLSATVTPLSSGDADGGTAVVISVVAHDADGDEVRSEGTVTVRPSADEVLIGEITFSAGDETAPPDDGSGIGGERPASGIGDEGPSQAPTGDGPQINPL